MAAVHEEKKINDDPVADSNKHHSGILKAILERAMANRFSSKPIDVQEKNGQQLDNNGSGREFLCRVDSEDRGSVINSVVNFDGSISDFSDALHGSTPTLTEGEQAYLECLLQSEDHDSIRQAIVALSDRNLFLREDRDVTLNLAKQQRTEQLGNNNGASSPRDFAVQRLLFRMHEIGRVPKSTAAIVEGSKRRTSWYDRKDSILETQTSMSSFVQEEVKRNHFTSKDTDDYRIPENDQGLSVDRSSSSTTTQDISSWLDGGSSNCSKQGPVVVGPPSDAIIAAEHFFQSSFAILGTTGDDASCHPHVLTPPLMESLMEFVPESLTDYHFWIKYSLIRDGPSLYTLLRQVRPSTRTILAIETTDGQVFGAFTSSPWRLVNNITVPTKENDDGEGNINNSINVSVVESIPPADNAFYGSKESFLWKMRHSRFDSQQLVRDSTVEQAILMESELAVFPFTGRNPYVQHCGPDDGIGLGEQGAALHLDANLRSGSTGASETFGNPCLIDPKQTQVSFQVSNLEIWTLTPTDKVKDAERAELETLFQQRRHYENSKLDLLGILVGGAKCSKC